MTTTRFGLWLIIVSFAHSSQMAAGYFATNTTVLVPDVGTLAYPNAFGPLKGSVSANLALTLEFSIVAGSGYVAGFVAVVTNRKGRVVRLVKQNQVCSVSYHSDGSVKRVQCTGRRRWLGLEAGPISEDDSLESRTESEEGRVDSDNDREHLRVDRRLESMPCAACAALVHSAVTSTIQPICGERFRRRLPSRYAWPARVAAALCNLTSSDLLDPVDLAYRTCRCCIENSDCPGGTCSAGVCLTRKLRSGEPCPDFEDRDCEDGRCALGSYPSGVYVCCPSIEYNPFPDNITNNYYCTRTQAIGATCNHDAMCMGPGRCASGTYPKGPSVCCDTGNFYSTRSKAWYCTKIRKVGEPCDANEMCTSGVCSRGICLGQKLAVGAPCPDRDGNDCLSSYCGRGSYPSGKYVCCTNRLTISGNSAFCSKTQGVGAACGGDDFCTSGICSGGVCVAGRAGQGESCVDDNGCSNRKCARRTYPSGPKVCCASNSSGYSKKFKDYYCGAIQGIGSKCDVSAICASGVCSGEGKCVASRLGAGQTCVDDAGCLSGSCAKSSYPSGPSVCCQSGRSSYSSQRKEYYCTATQPVGKPCFANEICASSVCSQGVCLATKIGAGKPCPDMQPEDCQSGACALNSYPTGRYVCCANSRQLASPVAGGPPYCANIQGAGSPCFANELCASGVCSGGICQSEKIYDGEPCPDGDDDDDCRYGACGRAFYPTGEYVCCLSGRKEYNGLTRMYYCADG